MQEEVRYLKYLGEQDLSVWLENANDDSPIIYPSWPKDFPVHVPVFTDAQEILAVALSRKAMLRARDPERLWFCRISLRDLLDNTDADASLFEGG